MPKNHSRYTWGQAGADVGTCPECGQRKVLYDGKCSVCNKFKCKKYIPDGTEWGFWGKITNLDRIRAKEYIEWSK